MKTKMSQVHTLSAALLLAPATLISAASLYAQTFTIAPITPPAGTYGAVAEGLNNVGQVAGYTTVRVGTGTKATVVRGPAFWWENGNSTILPPVAGKHYSEAHALSDNGMAVGISFDIVNGQMTDYHATRWLRNTDGTFTPADLNSILPAGPNLEPQAISEDGRFIGIEGTALGPVLAEFDASGQLVSYSVLGVNSVWDIRMVPLGDLLITGDLANGHAFLWDSENLTDLHPTIPGSSFGTALNHLKQVAGVYRVNGANRPVYWTESAAFVDIFAGKATGGYALGINDAGYVVGWATLSKPGPASTVFLWSPSTGARDLNSLKSATDTSGVSLNWAGKINNAGQILARGSTKTTSSLYVLMQP